MEKKKVQKLNKAVVATVLAASGVTITAPVLPTKASMQFKDLDPNADYYQPVLELASRVYISGYKDGTFRPNQAVTRGQAAKMLANALNLNVTNPSNPGFRDVPTNHDYYKYIAALSNEGIINGYDDKTFRPNEPINRNQMAKIITLGYKFQVSTKQTHGFADVSESNANRYFIQTLYDLGITKGTTGITYSPFGSVTRGQLATFIVRAENTSAEKVKPIKEIGAVIGTDVYINGIKYRVDTSLRDIINDKNAAALKGAHIEGQIVGETLKTISSLTINAQGTANRMLTFDGNNTTFSGELKVQGNYILFKNWNLSGPVTIAETPRRTLSDFANMRVASLTGFGFIDWEKPTDTTEKDDDPTYNGGGNDLTDKPAIDTGGKLVDRMPIIEKYVDFSNCTLQRLVIEANRTYVAATTKLPNVTVQGWVRQFEIYANIGTLYIEPDVKTTMFGVGDIDTIYKNSFKDVFLNSDSHVKLIVVDNSGGWIDLGNHFYADKVIIPPNKMPNDIFNDFIKDNDKIGDIEDSNGNDVDRDPIENTIIPDMEAPTAQIGKITVQGSSMTAAIKSSEDGYYYFTIRKADDRIPTIREIIEEAETTTLKTSGTGWIEKDKERIIEASELDENAEYVLYLITKDEADNYSDKVSKSFKTNDGTPPTIMPVTAEGLPGGKRVKVKFNPSETGTYYYYYRPTVDAIEDPTAQGIIERFEANVSSTGSGKVTVAGEMDFTISNLDAETSYDIYLVMKDANGNLTPVPVKVTVTTTELDNVNPYVVDGQLHRVSATGTDFYFYVNELLDPVTANDPNNYILSGTGIVNVLGQKEIKPDSVKFEAANGPNGAKGKVTISIPSVTGFVNGDTLRVKVLPGVKDLAENEFINENIVVNIEDLRNFADYTHSDALSPILKNLKFTPNQDETKGILEFNSNKAGSFYYMILPDDFDFTAQGITARDFYNEFSLDSSEHSGKFDIVDANGSDVKAYIKKDGENNKYPVVVGDQETVIDLPATPPRDPFKSYSIYMIVKDRSGLLSGIMNVSALKDSKAPFVTDYKVTATEGSNTSLDVSFTISEKGIAYYQAIPKYTEKVDGTGKELNPRIKELDDMTDDARAKAIKASGTAHSISKAGNYTGKLSGLDPHEEYIVYLAVEDQFGNITNHPAESVANNLVHGTGKLKVEAYTDGVKPEIGKILKKSLLSDFDNYEGRKVDVNWETSGAIGDGKIEYVENQTFTVSFSEAISISTGDKIPVAVDDEATLKALKEYIEKQIGTTIKDIEWQKLDDLNTWDERNLIITFNSEVTTSTTIDMTDEDLKTIVDLSKKSFSDSANKAIYEYPAKSINLIRKAALTNVQTSGYPAYSKTMEALLELGVEVTWNQKYYYATTSTSQSELSIAEANLIIKSLRENQPIQNATNVLVYGMGTITSSNNMSMMLPMDTEDMPNARPNDVFQEGQHLFIFTLDMYGNIVWAIDEEDKDKDPTVDTIRKYRVITKP